MKKVHVLLGDFIFYDEDIDNDYKCFINCIDEIVEIDEDLAEEFCEEMLDTYESYLILEMYKGKIEI